MKRAHHLCRIRVNGAEVRSLEKVAALTSPGEIGRVVRAGVLFGNDVVEVKRPEGKVGLVEQTVFTTPTGAVADQSAGAWGHYAPERSARWRRASACSKTTRSPTSTKRRYSAFFGRERATVALGGQNRKAAVGRRIGAQRKNLFAAAGVRHRPIGAMTRPSNAVALVFVRMAQLYSTEPVQAKHFCSCALQTRGHTSLGFYWCYNNFFTPRVPPTNPAGQTTSRARAHPSPLPAPAPKPRPPRLSARRLRSRPDISRGRKIRRTLRSPAARQ